MKTLTISLPPRQLGALRAAVESGAYASSSEVVRDALRLWEEREEVRRLELGRLKRAYEEGLASGAGRRVDPAALLTDLKAEARRGV
jgi:antitoxin ParD1/3/4